MSRDLTTRTATHRSALIEDIFQRAIQLSASERSAYIDRACGGDEALRAEVESLVAHDGDATAMLRSVVSDDLAALSHPSGADGAEIGRQLGPYRIVREIDRGGMGVVYLAVRSDDHYFQIVAVKTIRKGFESSALVQRFRTERQILANLSHPHIGAILDGGEADDGRPFLVMEYVEGQPITTASESKGLSIRERIDLFRDACSAVRYAHQKLVIHRDIKPSNILVTPDGLVKLIDFGISKPLAPESMATTLPNTVTGERLMTPDYASPEQVRGQPLTTATDIYSMGVLLYELLTGSRPYTLRDASPAEAERIICEQAVQKPSAVGGLSERTRKELAGDLDRIVLMAMEKEPSRRYASAEQLDDDLGRFLQGRPVLARRATATYRFRKLVQRHPAASLLTCAIVVTLGGSLLFQSWQSRRANRRVQQVERLANATISDMTERLQRSPASTEAQAALAHSALAYLKQLEQSSHDPEVLLELSRAYGRVGDIEGSPFGPNLGHVGAAVTSYQESLKAAIEARARVVSEQSTRTVIEAYQRLARTEYSMGDLPTAARLYRESLAVAREFSQQQPEEPTRNRLLAANAFGLGEVESDSKAPDRALTNFRSALQALGGELTGNEDHDQLLGRVYLRIGRALNELGAQGEALEYYRRTIDVVEDLAKRSPPVKQATRNLFAAYHTIIGPLAGEELLNVGDAKRAQLYARKALAIAEAGANRDSANVAAQSDLAFAYWGMGSAFRSSQPAIASTWYRKSLALTEQLASGPDKQRQIALRSDALAAVLVGRAQGNERLRLLQRANMLRREASRSEPPVPDRRLHLMRSYCRLSDAELASNNLEHARAAADLAVPFFTEFTVRSPSLIVLRELGFCFESLGNVERRRAEGRGLGSAERSTARAASREWYQKSADVWAEWTRRGAATAESEIVRRRVEGLRGTAPDRKPRPVTH